MKAIRTLTDIQDATIVETVKGSRRTIIHCGPDVDSVAAFGAIVAPTWTRGRISQDGSYSFTKTSSYGEAVNLLRRGWPEGTAKIAKMAARITAKFPAAERVIHRYRPSVAPVGQMVINIHDIATGGPQPFIGRFKTTETTRGRKIVKLIFHNGVSCGVTSDVIEARGAAIAALIHVLEQNRIAVDVTAIACINPINAAYMWHVRPAGYPTNPDSLAFAMVHPAAFRRLTVAMMEHTPAPDVERLFDTYGRPQEFSEPIWKDVRAKYDIAIDSECCIDDAGKWRGRWTNAADQTTWIIAQLAKLGVSATIKA